MIETRDTGEPPFRLIHGDFLEISKFIPDESIDCIITDPPYPEMYLPLWEELGSFAMRTVKPSGFIVCYAGHIHLNKIMRYFDDAGLKFYWICSLNHTGRTKMVLPRHAIADHKPIIIYQRPPFKLPKGYFHDVLIGTGREKTRHEWEQSAPEIIPYIEAFTQEGDTVCDPFVGSGSIGESALVVNRKFLGIEIEKKYIDISQLRLANTWENRGREKD